MAEKIVVPDGMLKAAVDAAVKFTGANTIQASTRVKAEIEESFKVAVEAALLWLDAELPLPSISSDEYQGPEWDAGWNCAVKAVRRIFIALEPVMSEKIEDLFWNYNPVYSSEDRIQVDGHNAGIIEAFRRGK